MKVTMASLYGKKDIRMREVELPKIKDDEVLVEVVSNGICLSTHKALLQGEDHLRIPNNVSEVPVVTGHEFAGVIREVGKKWQGKYKVGTSCTIQAAYRYKGSEDAPGYSFEFFGGNTTYSILPNGLMEMDYVLTYDDDYFAFASLAEPMSCIIGAFNTLYHEKMQEYDLYYGNKDRGNMALMASCGPMGLGAIDYAIHGPRKPKNLVVTDIDESRIERAKRLLTVEEAKRHGVNLTYVNTKDCRDVQEDLMQMVDGEGFDDIIIFAAVPEIIELGANVLGYNGCLNFFAGPINKDFFASINFYDVHYRKTHFVGNSGGNLDDIKECLDMSTSGKLHPEFMITHVCGLKEVPETLLHLPNIPGGKKLVYTHIDLPLMALEDFAKQANENPIFKEVADILEKNDTIWCKEAEQALLKLKQ